MRCAAARPPSLWKAWAGTYALLWAFTLATALLVIVVPGACGLARGLLHLKLTPSANPPPSVATVTSIAANNLLRSVWPLALGPLGAARNRFTRMLADGAVLANLLACGLLVGGALGGYDARVLPYLPHVPVEWAGIAAGATGWLLERARKMRTGQRLQIAAVAVSLFLCAALAETRLAPHCQGPHDRSLVPASNLGSTDDRGQPSRASRRRPVDVTSQGTDDRRDTQRDRHTEEHGSLDEIELLRPNGELSLAQRQLATDRLELF